MKLRLEPLKKDHVVAEDVKVRVVIENDGSAPLAVPDPVDACCRELTYLLVPPGAADDGEGDGGARRFTPCSLAFGDDPGLWPVEPPAELRIEPGAARAETLVLSQWMPLARPGRYKLSAGLAVKGETAEAAPVEFTVAPLAARAVGLGFDAGVPDAKRAGLVWIHEAEGGARSLYGATLVEDDPGLGLWRAPRARFLAGVGKKAEDPLVPWTNYDRRAEVFNWRAWREGAAILALPAFPEGPPRRCDLRACEFIGSRAHREGIAAEGKEEEVLQLEKVAGPPTTQPSAARPSEAPREIDSQALSAPPARVLRPALMPRAGSLDVFAIVGEDLVCARFPAPEEGAPPADGAVAWRAPLEGGPPLGGGAALGPAEVEGERPADVRHVVVAVRAGGGPGILLQLFSAAPDATEVPLRDAALAPGLLPIPGAEIAVRANDDGSVDAAFVAIQPGEPAEGAEKGAEPPAARLVLVEVQFPSHEEASRPLVLDLGPAGEGEDAAPPRAAAAAYSPLPGAPQGASWLVLFADGRVLHGVADEPALPAPAPLPGEAGEPVLPLALLPLSHSVYALTIPAGAGPALHALP